jgi:hypothetical protein
MSFIIEAVKHRIELLKLIGIGLCTPCATIVLLMFTDEAYISKHFSLKFFLVSILMTVFGVACIMRSIDLIDSYLSNKKDDL